MRMLLLLLNNLTLFFAASDSSVTLMEFLTNFTYKNMLLGTTMIGATSGALGCFLYLRKQSLISDVIGHSAIFGVMGAFILVTIAIGGNGRNMFGLIIGSIIAATLSVLLTNWIARNAVVGIDAAMAICLSLFYGGGMVLVRVILNSSLPDRGGIDKYIFGNASTLVRSDIYSIYGFGIFCLLIMIIFWKEFKIFTFDQVFSETLGFKASIIDPILLTSATIAVVIGVKAVGLILMIAFALMPAAAARQWSKRLSSMVALATIIGAGSAVMGSFLSVNMGKTPSGPVIVLVLFAVFIFSILFAPGRSILRRTITRRAKAKELQHLADSRLDEDRVNIEVSF